MTHLPMTRNASELYFRVGKLLQLLGRHLDAVRTNCAIAAFLITFI